MRISAILFAVLLHSNVFACTCAGFSPLITKQSAPLVIDGAVRRYISGRDSRYPIAMDVEVIRVLHGNYRAKTIRIFGDFGASCVPYVSRFPIGTEWVFAVHGPVWIRDMGDENFGFEACSASGLPVKNGRVTGAITSTTAQDMSLDELRRAVAEMATHR